MHLRSMFTVGVVAVAARCAASEMVQEAAHVAAGTSEGKGTPPQPLVHSSLLSVLPV
jgi:hypothetical protein